MQKMSPLNKRDTNALKSRNATERDTTESDVPPIPTEGYERSEYYDLNISMLQNLIVSTLDGRWVFNVDTYILCVM